MPKKPKKFGTGVLEDNRTPSQRLKDYQHAEVATTVAPTWTEIPPSQWRKFPIFNQDGSGSCVAQATTKVLGVENFLEEGEFVHLSARDLYTRRINASEGMFFYNALSIASEWGATLEPLMPSQNKDESAMNKSGDRKKYTEQIAKIFKAGGYVQLPLDIDQVASVIEKGKAVLLGFRFNYDEWTDVPTIKTAYPQLHHGVAGTIRTLWQGKKAIVIEDSWGEFGQFKGQRVITEDFFKERCSFAGYVLDLPNDWREGETPEKPHHTFSTVMQFGETNEEVKWLQKVLRYEQLFPQTTEITGYYGALTSKGVLAFQKRHKVAPDSEIDPLYGRLCGQKTISMLSQLYS